MCVLEFYNIGCPPYNEGMNLQDATQFVLAIAALIAAGVGAVGVVIQILTYLDGKPAKKNEQR